MAAFAYAEPSQAPRIMANSNDFTLFPQYDWNSEQAFMPATTYQDQAYLQATTFDSAFSQPAYAQPLSMQTPYGFTSMQQFAVAEKAQHPLSPRQSPTNSASNSFDCPQPNFMSSISESGASVQSTISSAMASPSVHARQHDWTHQAGMSLLPNIVQPEDTFATTSLEYETIPVIDAKGCVDPSLIQPFSPQFAIDGQPSQAPQQGGYATMPSPAPSVKSGKSSRAGSLRPLWQPYPAAYSSSRRQSVSSVHSRHSEDSLSSDDSSKGLCPIASCGRHFKDLKAHMLTHQETRPEKCPIPTCDYHLKGFARKYDKNRHTLTHYKGTMVCGFCPGSGSAVEKSFNRADVFKRHLTSVHGVEQTPPNARRKTPATAKRPAYGVRAAPGMCSTCNNAFASPQDFYEHLDDCVLRVVQQIDPSEAVNAKLLASIADDAAVQDTLERHMLSTDLDGPTSFDDEDEAEEEEDDDSTGTRSKKVKARKSAVGGAHLTSTGAIGKTRPRKGLTFSKGGVSLAGGAMSGRGSKRRKNYPLSWGAAPEKMRMKKRVLCVYDGQRRLWKDDMMLDSSHEVRIPLSGVGDGRAWVSDLDVCTMQRAEGLHNATEAERGPWIPDEEMEELMKTT